MKAGGAMRHLPPEASRMRRNSQQETAGLYQRPAVSDCSTRRGILNPEIALAREKELDIDNRLAHWIWYPGAQNTVNFHFFARKVLSLPSAVRKAVIHITAFTDYTLFVNERFVGRGPQPGDPARLVFYDTHDVTAYLEPGENVIGVLCHNYGIGIHGQHKGPGGLLAQVEIETEDGITRVGSDASWRVRRGDCFHPNSPRMFWSAGFMETFDFHRFERDWLEADFDDSGWEAAEALKPPAVQTRWALEAREIPPLRERFVEGQVFERGRFELSGLHVVPFGPLLPPGEAGLVYAQTFVWAEEDTQTALQIICDDAFKAFLNGELVLEQNYDEGFVRTRVWRGFDEYDQVHYGVTGAFWPPKTPLALRRGWNRLTVAVDQGAGGWGFVLALLKPGSDEIVEPAFSADKQTPNTWVLAGPFESTGMNDSLDDVANSLDNLPPPAAVTVDPFCYDQVTDYATLMTFEKRRDLRQADASDWIALNEGEWCIVDLGNVRVGYPTVRIETAQDAILDIGYGQVLFDDRRLRFSNDGMLKYVDRLYVAGGSQEWQPLQRRTGRYVHISCRQGRNVRLSHLGIWTIGYPVETVGRFECADALLNRIWDVSRYTAELLMQDGYQDCLKREQGTLNASSFNYTSRAAACCFGDTRLARKCLRTAILTQHDDGWFDTHGLSSPNNDEITECLWWIVWLKDYLLCSGDLDFVAEVFTGVENTLRFFGKMVNRRGLIDRRNYHISRKGQIVYLDDACSYSEFDWVIAPAEPAGRKVTFEAEIFGFNVLFHAALSAAATLASVLGLEERAATYRKRAERVRRFCNERFWDEQKGLYAELRVGDERKALYHPIVQIAALHFGICNEQQRARVLDYLVNDLGLPERSKADYPLTTFGYYYYFLEVLFRHGREDMALALLRQYYGSWLEAGATTFGEYYHMARHNNHGQLDREYEVHAYGTSALLHFYTNILGVRPLEPGFTKVLLSPRPGDLAWASGALWTPQGVIRISWKQEGAAFAVEVEAPTGCAIQFDLPARYQERSVRVNGKIVIQE